MTSAVADKERRRHRELVGDRSTGSGKRSGDPGFPRTLFVVHGDPAAEAALEPKVRALGFNTHVPKWREHVTLA